VKIDFAYLLPELAMTGVIVLCMIQDMFAKKDAIASRRIQFPAVCGILVVLALLLSQWGLEGKALLSNMIVVDRWTVFFKAICLTGALFVLFITRAYASKLGARYGEFVLLVLFAGLAMMFVVAANDLIMLFLAIELLTLSFCVMAAFLRDNPNSVEAGLKYLIIGSLSACLFLFGIVWIYGMITSRPDILTGSATGFASIRHYLAVVEEVPLGFYFGMFLVFAGVGFKIAAVPLHLWVPDVYQGSPTPATTFFAVGSKAAGVAGLLRLTAGVFGGAIAVWVPVIAVVAALTICYGNLVAIPQRNLKRLLAYSSIGHAGYILIGIAAGSSLGMQAVMYYLVAYLFTTLAAFSILTVFFVKTGSHDICNYEGLSMRSPFLAGAMFIALLSLAGVPPFAGFFGKFLVLYAVIESGMLWLALIGAVNVIISLYYYLGVVKAMYFKAPEDEAPITTSLGMRAVIVVCLAGIILLGICQQPVMNLIEQAVAGFTK